LLLANKLINIAGNNIVVNVLEILFMLVMEIKELMDKNIIG